MWKKNVFFLSSNTLKRMHEKCPLPVNFYVGTSSPVHQAVLPLFDKAQPREDAHRLSKEPGEDVLGEDDLHPDGEEEEAEGKRDLLETLTGWPACWEVEGSDHL